MTDNSGATSTTTVPVQVRSPYQASVLGTAGLVDYWRLGETSGTTFADSVGGANADHVQRGQPRRVATR